MRLLANENIPTIVIEALQAQTHDVEWIRRCAPGSTDPEVIERARREDRVLLTFDKDFGELAFHQALPATSGVILVRIPVGTPDSLARRITEIIGSRNDWHGHFSVIEPHRLRMVPLR